MLRFIWSFLLLILISPYFGQSDPSSCSGNISISENTKYTVSFKGGPSKNKNAIIKYCDLPLNSNNFVWVHFQPKFNGEFLFLTPNLSDSLSMFIFETRENQGCSVIDKGLAKLVSCEQRASQDEKPLKYSVKQDFNYYLALYMKKGVICNLDVELQFTPLTTQGTIFKDSINLNLIYDQALPVFSLHFRDKTTKFPVVARLYLSASSAIDGTYRASDLSVNNNKKLKAKIRVESEGYYSTDISSYVIPNSTFVDTIWLSPIIKGTVSKIEDIYFAGGLATILDESMPRLKRLKDFLTLNPRLSIEVQGHVNDEGKKNSMSAQRLSRKRAQKIVDYLIDCGIDPSRLSAVGYGNTKPIFASPTNEQEEEANRRVEIEIR